MNCFLWPQDLQALPFITHWSRWLFPIRKLPMSVSWFRYHRSLRHFYIESLITTNSAKLSCPDLLSVLRDFSSSALMEDLISNSIRLGMCLLLQRLWGGHSMVLLHRKFCKKGYPLPYVTRKIFFYGAIGMLPFSLIMDFKPNFALLVQPENLLPFLYLALISSCGGFVIWNFAVKHLGAVTTNLYLYLVPILSILFSGLFLHEKITGLSILGSFLVLLGLAISEMDSLRTVLKRRSE